MWSNIPALIPINCLRRSICITNPDTPPSSPSTNDTRWRVSHEGVANPGGLYLPTDPAGLPWHNRQHPAVMCTQKRTLRMGWPWIIHCYTWRAGQTCLPTIFLDSVFFVLEMGMAQRRQLQPRLLPRYRIQPCQISTAKIQRHQEIKPTGATNPPKACTRYHPIRKVQKRCRERVEEAQLKELWC